MKKVIKVSIGNIAFTLEEEAHSELKGYLDSLELHYSAKDGGSEIVEGIEERVAELLVERGYSQKVVTVEVVREIMSILGKPEEIESESDSQEPSDSPKKKLYRNLQDKRLGGVCSGIASYFAIDATAIRIITVVLGLVSAISSDGAGLGLFILLYFALWVIIPGAKTVEQRCRMKGEDTTVNTIEKNIKEGVDEIVNSSFGKGFVKVVSILMGISLVVAGVAGLGVAAFLVFGAGLSLLGLSVLSGVSAGMSIAINILFAMAVILPFVGMLYGGIMLLFQLKSPRWRPGLINFIVWLLACISLAGCMIKASSDYWDCDSVRDVEDIAITSDTLYVRYADVELCKNKQIFINASRTEYDLFYLDRAEKSLSLTLYPELDLQRVDDGYSRIRSSYDVFPKTLSFDEWQDKSMK
jgi:phage shock protein PspC (stress-responsive transcriptional regulator)